MGLCACVTGSMLAGVKEAGLRLPWHSARWAWDPHAAGRGRGGGEEGEQGGRGAELVAGLGLGDPRIPTPGQGVRGRCSDVHPLNGAHYLQEGKGNSVSPLTLLLRGWCGGGAPSPKGISGLIPGQAVKVLWGQIMEQLCASVSSSVSGGSSAS